MNPSIKYGGDTCNTEWLGNYRLFGKSGTVDGQNPATPGMHEFQKTMAYLHQQ